MRDVIEAIRKVTAAIRLRDENLSAADDVRGAALVVLPQRFLEALTYAEPDSLRRGARLTIGQERDRKRVPSELDDGLGQALTLIKLVVEDSLMRIRRGNVDEATALPDTTVGEAHTPQSSLYAWPSGLRLRQCRLSGCPALQLHLSVFRWVLSRRA